MCTVTVSQSDMATRPGSGQCLLDCPEEGEPLATRRESERRETELTMDSLNLGERTLTQSAYRHRAVLGSNENLRL